MDFIMGGKLNSFKYHFCEKKMANIGPEYTERCRIGTFGGGGCFLRKVDFVIIFMR